MEAGMTMANVSALIKLLDQLSSGLRNLPYCIQFFSDLSVSVNRINSFLLADNIEDDYIKRVDFSKYQFDAREGYIHSDKELAFYSGWGKNKLDGDEDKEQAAQEMKEEKKYAVIMKNGNFYWRSKAQLREENEADAEDSDKKTSKLSGMRAFSKGNAGNLSKRKSKFGDAKKPNPEKNLKDLKKKIFRKESLKQAENQLMGYISRKNTLQRSLSPEPVSPLKSRGQH